MTLVLCAAGLVLVAITAIVDVPDSDAESLSRQMRARRAMARAADRAIEWVS